MRSYKSPLVLLSVGIGVLFVSMPTSAELLLFSDNFDGYAVGEMPNAPSAGWYGVHDPAKFPNSIAPNIRAYDGLYAAASSPNYLQVTRTSAPNGRDISSAEALTRHGVACS